MLPVQVAWDLSLVREVLIGDWGGGGAKKKRERERERNAHIWRVQFGNFFIEVYFSRALLCLVIQFCPTLRDPMDCSPWGSFAHGASPGQNTAVGSLALLQGIFPTQGLNPGLPHCWRILHHLSHQRSPWRLEWVAYAFSRGSSWPRNRPGVSWITGGFFSSRAIREAQILRTVKCIS